MHFFLQINPQRAIGTNNFIAAHTRIRRNIPSGVRNSHILGVITNDVVRPLNCCRGQLFQEYLVV